MKPNEYYHHNTGFPVGDVVKAWKQSYNISTAITYLARAGLKTEDPKEDLFKAIHHILMEMVDCRTAQNAMFGVRAWVHNYEKKKEGLE